MAGAPDRERVDILSHNLHHLNGGADDYNELMTVIGDASVVLLGESTHGSHEFYRERAHISRRLIAEKGFNAIAAEADWPDAYQVNRYVKGEGDSMAANEALAGFARFPTWMWRNTDILELAGWLREHNDNQGRDSEKAGFFGLDLYSLYASVREVIRYLESVDPEAAQKAKARYGCFDHYDSINEYGYLASLDLSASCQQEVLAQMGDMHKRRVKYREAACNIPDDHFDAEQNARVVKNAEAYYRSMYFGNVVSWNLRDSHMAESLEQLINHLEKTCGRAKLIVWAHNSHIGDARATDMGRFGELNIGQLARQKYGARVFNIGFSTYDGTVTAASQWDGPAERKTIQPGLPGSYERLFHDTGVPNFWLNLRDNRRVAEALSIERLERAIGVIYQPRTERQSHYFHAVMPDQFDAVIHFDHTRAVEPLERSPVWETAEPYETWPTAL